MRSLVLSLLLLSCASHADDTASVGVGALDLSRATPIPLPGGAPGIGFDDLRLAGRALLVPGGRSGNLDVFDPTTRQVTSVPGFARSSSFDGGHDFGATSADAADGKFLVTDRTTARLSVVEGSRITGQVALAASPDYVRFVARTNEVWVTEPDAEQIEIFSVSPNLAHTTTIPIANGPESLVIDATRGRAYTNLWTNVTVAIDTASRAIVGRWTNDCNPGTHTNGHGSRGIALDEGRGFVFVGCCEGQLAVVDAANGGKRIWRTPAPAQVDIVDFDPSLHHLYAASGGRLSIVGVSTAGRLATLGSINVPGEAHCVVSDHAGNAYVCDPRGGRLLEVKDGFPASR